MVLNAPFLNRTSSRLFAEEQGILSGHMALQVAPNKPHKLAVELRDIYKRWGRRIQEESLQIAPSDAGRVIPNCRHNEPADFPKKTNHQLWK